MPSQARGDADPDALADAVNRVRNGDLDAYGEIVERCLPPVRAWIAVRCPPAVDPEDLAHETFIAAYQRLGDFRAGSPMIPWLIGFARNLLRNEIRKSGRRSRLHRGYGDLLPETGTRTDGDSTGTDDGVLAALRRCLERIQPEARALLDLRYGEDLAVEAISQRTGRPPAAIARTLHAVRKALHACINGHLRSGAAS